MGIGVDVFVGATVVCCVGVDVFAGVCVDVEGGIEVHVAVGVETVVDIFVGVFVEIDVPVGGMTSVGCCDEVVWEQYQNDETIQKNRFSVIFLFFELRRCAARCLEVETTHCLLIKILSIISIEFIVHSINSDPKCATIPRILCE